jgi:hypothetical protein
LCNTGSKSIDEFKGQDARRVDHRLRQRARVVPDFCRVRKKKLHWSFDDPANATGTDEEKLSAFRRVRDEIRNESQIIFRRKQPVSTHETVREKVREGYANIAVTNARAAGRVAAAIPTWRRPSAIQRRNWQTCRRREYGFVVRQPDRHRLLQPEVVLDLGSGGGFDVFIAGQESRADRPSWRGHDAGDDRKARRNIPASGLTTLSSVWARSSTCRSATPARIVISNCVINLSPDKPQVWRRDCRVLNQADAWRFRIWRYLNHYRQRCGRWSKRLFGCVAAAVLREETERMARAAGLGEHPVEAKPDWNAMSDFKDPLYQKIVDHLPAGTTPAISSRAWRSLHVVDKPTSCSKRFPTRRDCAF